MEVEELIWRIEHYLLLVSIGRKRDWILRNRSDFVNSIYPKELSTTIGSFSLKLFFIFLIFNE